MKNNKLKPLFKLLLIKKHNFHFTFEEAYVLNKLQNALVLENKLKKCLHTKECSCELNSETIAAEIEINKCLDCGLPICIH